MKINKSISIAALGLALIAMNGRTLATDACTASFFDNFDLAKGLRRSVLVPAEGVDPRATIERVRQLASSDGFEIGAMDHNGSEASLTFIDIALQKFPIHITVDGALGAISITTRLNPDQMVNQKAMEKYMCNIVARATITSPVSTMQKEPARSSFFSRLGQAIKNASRSNIAGLNLDEMIKTMNENTVVYNKTVNDIVQRALAAGKSVVIVPSINLESKFSADDVKNEVDPFRSDRSSTTIWQSTTNPKDIVEMGYDSSFNLIGLHGYFYRFNSEKIAYFAYIVNPGTYAIVGDTHDIEEAQMPEARSSGKPSSNDIGSISFAAVKNSEFYKDQKWFDAMYANKRVDTNYCSTEIVGGPCVGWATDTQYVTQQVSAAGWREVLKEREVDGLVVATKLSKRFASFTVKPRDVAVVDGFFSEYPNADFRNDVCAQMSGNQIQCSMSKYALIRIRARADDVHDQVKAIPQLTDIVKAFESAQYVPSTVEATPDTFVAGWGQNYMLKQN